MNRPATEAGEAAWRAIAACENQVRAVAEAGAYAWDFPAVLQYAALTGVDLDLMADLLPQIEPLVLHAHSRSDDP